jgi:phage tail-like protein
MPLSDSSKIGLANRFTVTVEPGKWDLGSWAQADGLDVTWEVSEYRAGDAGNARYIAPAFTKYTAVKLTRAVSLEDSPNVKKFLGQNSFNHDVGAEVTIKLHDSFGKPVLDWTLRNAMVKKWGVTKFDAGGSAVSIETLEWDHTGFLDDEMKLA